MIDKRIFFLTTNPGLESAAHLELCKKWAQAADFFNLSPYPDVETSKGGIEFEAPFAMGLYLNQNIKTATRILLREKSFSAKNENEFQKGLESISWDQYFSPQDIMDFKFQSKSSKLSHSKQVARVLEKVLKKHKVKLKKSQPTVFIRLFRDQCTISLDSTGEAGYHRKQGGSIASLRSSLASGLLQVLLQGMNKDFELIDPMCGSGTLLVEALSSGIPQNRSFQIEKFASFKREDHLDRMSSPSSHPNLKKVWGFDIHDKALDLSQKNLAHFSADQVEIKKADLFKSTQGTVEESDLKRVLVVNPPWGKRLHTTGHGDILKSLFEKYKPDRIGLLMPARWKTSRLPLEKVRDLPILNSGVENRFLVFSKVEIE